MADNVQATGQKLVLNKVYAEYMQQNKRISILYGGRGSAKTFTIIVDQLHKCLNKPGRNVAVVMAEYNRMYDKVIKDILKVARMMGVSSRVRFKTSPSYTVIVSHPNGENSTFTFFGGDNPEKLKGLSGIDVVWIEEANNVSYSAYKAIDFALRDTDRERRIILSFNPESENHWIKKRFFDKRPGTERKETRLIDGQWKEVDLWETMGGYHSDDVFILKTTYKDNNFGGNREAREDYRKKMDALKKSDRRRWEVWANGNWGVSGDVVFTNYRTADFDPTDLLNRNAGLRKVYGADHGGMKKDPNAFVASLVDVENKKVYVYDEYLGYDQMPDEFARVLINRGYGTVQLHADNQHVNVEAMRRAGMRRVKAVKKGKRTPEEGAIFLRQFEIIIHPSCKGLIREIQDYKYKQDKNEETLDRIDDSCEDHCIDALRYSMQEIFTVKEMRQINRMEASDILGVNLPF